MGFIDWFRNLKVRQLGMEELQIPKESKLTQLNTEKS